EGPGVLIEHAEQGAGLAAGGLDPAPQGRHAGGLPGLEDFQQGVQVGQADAAGWADAGEGGLPIRIEDHGLAQAAFAVGHVLFQFADALAEGVEALPWRLAIEGGDDVTGFAVEALAADAALAGQALDLAVVTAVDHKGTGHGRRGWYDAHG